MGIFHNYVNVYQRAIFNFTFHKRPVPLKSAAALKTPPSLDTSGQNGAKFPFSCRHQIFWISNTNNTQKHPQSSVPVHTAILFLYAAETPKQCLKHMPPSAAMPQIWQQTVLIPPAQLQLPLEHIPELPSETNAIFALNSLVLSRESMGIGNGIIINNYGSFPHSLLSTSK